MVGAVDSPQTYIASWIREGVAERRSDQQEAEGGSGHRELQLEVASGQL